MKLQGWIVIFILIIVPIILVTSSYLQLQISYVNAQANYDSVLSNAAYDAIKAFQINELNSNTQNIAEEKIRDVEASVNTFYNSLATNFGQAGYSQEELSGYIPALVYTLYDGYYIYTKYNNIAEVDDTTGDTVIDLNSNDSTDGLKPFVYYSARYVEGQNEAIINYTLDNYITVFLSGPKATDGYETFSGYLVNPNDITISGSTYRYKGINIVEENLSEANITSYAGKDQYDGTYDEMPYVYVDNSEGRREKAYYDGSRWFKYNVDGSTLNYDDQTIVSELGSDPNKKDNSARLYLEEAKNFSEKVRTKLSWINYGDIVDVSTEDLGISNAMASKQLIDFSDEGMENFEEHKKQIIRNSITTNLKATIAKMNANSAQSAKMPTLSELEWDRILNNTCLLAFMQGQNLGYNEYMGYTIVTNNLNREFVDPKLIYIYDKTTNTYHDFRHLDAALSSGAGTNLVGYRNIDFEPESFNDVTGSPGQYYPHRDATADYSCIVSSSDIITGDGTDATQGNQALNPDEVLAMSTNNDLKSAYYTALFRERYNAYKSLDLGEPS